MKEIYSNNNGKTVPATLRAGLLILLTLGMWVAVITQSYAQCTGGGCNATISNNNNYSIPAGQTYCLQYSNYTGTITFNNGSILCIGSGITWSGIVANFTGTTGTINNYGNGSESFPLPSGYTFNNNGTYSGALTQNTGSTVTNSGTFSGSLTQNGGTFTNNSAGTLSGTSSIGGTFTNNGTITGAITIISGGTLTNTHTLAASITMNTGSTFSNSSTYSGTMTNTGGAITNSGTISNTFALNGTLTNTGTISNGLTINTGATATNTSGTINSTITINGGTFINNTSLSGNITMSSGSTFTNSSTYSGTLTNTGGAITNSGTISTAFTVNGTLSNTGTISNGLTIGSAGLATNSGTINNGITISGGSFTNNSNLSSNVTMTGSSTFTNASTYSGTLTNTGGAIINSGTISNSFTLNGTLNNTGTLSSGLTIANGGIATNNGTVNNNITINNGGTLINNHALSGNITMATGSTFNNTSSYTGNMTNNGGAITNSGSISSNFALNGTINNTGTLSGTLTVANGASISNTGTISGSTTVNSGGSITNNSGGSITGATSVTGTLTNNGAITGGISLSSGGILNNNSTTTLNAPVTMATGSTFNNYTKYTGALTQNGGIITNYPGATFSPSSTTLNGGTLTNDSLASVTLGNVTFPSGYVFTNKGAATLGNISLNSGAAVILTGTSQTVGTVGNNGTFTASAPATIGSLTQNSSAIANLSGGLTISGSVSNNGTINLAGSLTITGTYSDNSGATIRETQAGCNVVIIGINSGGSGTFNGNGNGLYVNSQPGNSGSLVNGATSNATVSAPTQQPTNLLVPLTGMVVNGSFTPPSTGASITGYMVLRYIGTTASTDNPASDGSNDTVGGQIGNSTIVAMVTGGSITTKTFTDNIPSGYCGDSIYYRVFAYNGGGPCRTFNTTSPLIKSVIIPIPVATITASGATTFCSGGKVILTASGGATYAWSNGIHTAADTIVNSGTYVATVTGADGCTATATSAPITSDTPSAITPYINVNGTGLGTNPVVTLCAGGSVEFSPQPAGGAWTYTGPAGFHSYQRDTTITNIQTSQSGTYVATYKDVNGCGSSQNFSVTVNALPTPLVTSFAACPGALDTLKATGGTKYAWSTGDTTANIVVSPTVNTTYTVVATNTSNCSATTTGTITMNAVPTVGITAGSATTFCAGGSVTLTASGTGISTYLWSTGATTAAITVNASNTYTVIVKNSTGCTATASQSVTVNPLPIPTVNNAVSCSGALDTLTATGGGTYKWSYLSKTTASITPSPAPTVNTTYAVTVTNSSTGCSVTASGTITVATNPTPTANNAAICPGGSATLTATGGTSYVWSTGATTASITPSPAATTIYTVTATNASGCKASTKDSIVVNPVPVATITAGGPTTFCAGGSVTLTAGGGATYLWSTGSTATAISAAAGGTYSVIAKSTFGCTASASQLVTVNALPAPTANNGISCSGATDTLTATGGTKYAWSTGDTTATIYKATGTYKVTVTNSSGCSAIAYDTVVAVANPTPVVNNPATCYGGTDTMKVSGVTAVSYLWSTNATTATITTITAGPYSVIVTNSSGCSATASGIATINPLPVPVVPNDTVCAGSIATLTASGGAAYVWSTGAHTASITTTVPATYTVTATSTGSCTATASGTVSTTPNPTASATNGVICSGSPTTLTASGGVSYVWSTGSTAASITTATAGTYTVTVSNAAGCTAVASDTATAATRPAAAANSNVVCAGGSATITATGAGIGGSYLWSTGATTASITVTPASTTYYTVIVKNAATCTSSVTDSVVVNPLPAAAATNGVICSLTPATITASGGTSYKWNTIPPATTASVTVALAGSYAVTVTNAATGCSATANSTVSNSTTPVPTVNNAAACNGTAAILTATVLVGGPVTYFWNTTPAATTASVSVNPAASTTYTVTVTNTAGCSATASGRDSVYALPSTTATSNSPILLGDSITLKNVTSSGKAGYTYQWNGPSSFTSTAANPTILHVTALNGGLYSITVTDANGCTATASTQVILNSTAPGGISSYMALWVRSNSLSLANGAAVSTWINNSGGNNLTQATAVNQPLFESTSADYVNYYPVVKFNGSNSQMTAPSFSGTSTFTQAHVFAVSKSVNNSQTGSLMYEAQATTSGESGRVNVHLPYGGTTYWDAGTCCTNNRLTTPFPASYANVPKLWSFSKDLAGTANGTQKQDIRTNGLTVATMATNTGFTGNNSTFNFGTDGGGDFMNGEVAEVIYYLGASINAASQNAIESYLAAKYGITLDQTTGQNYTASNGTIFWNAATNGVYKNNIFGVGIDNVSTLNQTQSVSINTNVLSLNTATGLTYYSFLMVSDNAGANTVKSMTGLPNGINSAISTVWKATQTGGRAGANYVFNSSSTNFGYYAPIASSMTVYMLIDSNADGVYESYATPTAVSGTNNTFNVSLRNGALFTFGFKANIDFGDAPGVPTLIANNGAGHMIVPGVYLGSLIDAEIDGQPSVNSLGDDTIGLADEDGINFNIGVPTTSNIVTMGTNSVIVTASTAGYLNAWIDLNQDNTYNAGGSEYVIQNVHLVAGPNTVTFSVSDSVEYGPTSFRFRFAQNLGDVTAPTGLATNGEVEDYKVYVTAPLVGACTNGFQNPGFEQGPAPDTGAYIITQETNLPYWRTTATDHKVEVWHTGFNGVPSHSGTYFVELEANLYGALYQDVYTTPGTRLLWSFAHRGRNGNDTAQVKIGAPGATVTQRTVIDGNTAWGTYQGSYTVPAGQYITRLEFWAVGSYGGDKSVGNFLDDVSVASSFDYGDAPNSYGTLFASNGPYHAITSNLYLGYGETCDGDGQPSAAANLDSLDDGVVFLTPCNSCTTDTVVISIYNNSGSPATVAGWIDFNKNGVFDASERKSITVPSSASEQTVRMIFNVTTFSAVSTGTYARFRIANDSTQVATPYGIANSGEVEDYVVPCIALPIPVPSYNPVPVCARGPLHLTASGSAPSYSWTGPNSFTDTLQNTTIASAPLADSGTYRVYAIYANGCERDSAVKVVIQNCYVNISGNIFDDANGNGTIDGTDAKTSNGQTIYAILSDNTNTVIDTSTIQTNGSFIFTNMPAYTTGMTIVASTTKYAMGSTSGGPLWPSRWTGTKEQYGTNNLAGTGLDNTPNLLAVNTGVSNVTNTLLGYDRLPTTTVKTYTIPYPHTNATLSLTPSNSLGYLAGNDPEDGVFSLGSTFTITSLAGMGGNTLYYDANGDGVLQSYEQITGYTTITNFDPTKLIIKFIGAGSTHATFNYGTTDAASKVDPTPATYTINWVGTLPVKMMYFTANKTEETKSLLKWATASEIDNDHFEVERSADAETWEKIGEQKGAGTTDVETDYSFTDAQPLPGINYYRLKQVDVDGNFTYSDIAQVTFEETGTVTTTTAEPVSTLKVYPNPLSQADKLNIQLNSTDDNISEITITNEIGQTVYTTTLPQIQTYQVFGLNLPSGVYIVSAHTQANNTLSSRLVITR